ncbi:Ig-like domain-containing protein [uncultured Metabacillus sp.]|uniref:Ig-like domain-containing protein n=1 Tax=uncultured Metabacillus sp. TaxID=2860135 RepID=UPI002613A0BF|nr:Ig-like domain-containing protein [uncultured Metabacillus sp.]
MRKKGIVSLVAVGLLALSLSVGTVKAEGNDYELSKKVVEDHVEKPLRKGIVDSDALNKLEKEIEGSKSVKSSGKTSIMGSSSTSEYIFEQEYNDDFDYANATSYEKPTIGQLLPLYDVDFHKVVVPKDGVLLVGGATNSYAIDLLFIATEYDYADTGKLEYLGTEYEDDIEIQVYQAKAGTYYVPVLDFDNDYYDDNTEQDLYQIATAFVDNVAPSKPTVNKVDNNDTVVTGKAEANSTVIVKNGNTQLGSAVATSKGDFSVKIKAQKNGTTLTVYAKDSAGNSSSGTTVKVADVIPPAKPVINRVDNNDKAVTGKAEPTSYIIVKVGSKVIGNGKTTSKGTFTTAIPVQKAGTKVTVISKDGAGNLSPGSTVTVVDVVAPSKPTINRVDSNDKVVKGKAEAFSIVTVKVGSKSIGSATAYSNGTYSVKIPAQKTGTTLSVTAKDKAGNVSQAATIRVVKP